MEQKVLLLLLFNLIIQRQSNVFSLEFNVVHNADQFNNNNNNRLNFTTKKVDVMSTSSSSTSASASTASTPIVSISNSQSQSINSFSISSSNNNNNLNTNSNNNNNYITSHNLNNYHQSNNNNHSAVPLQDQQQQETLQQQQQINDGLNNNGINMRNKPILNSLMSRLETLSAKLDRLGETQVQIQKSFDTLESRYTLSSPMDDVPQCGRRVDRVLRTLTPLVSRVEGLWNVVSGSTATSKVSERNLNVSPSQFLNAPPTDVLLSESRRQERAISAIKSDLNIRSQQIMSEIGTVEHQLDLLQANLRKPSSQPLLIQPTSIDQADQLATDIQNNNDVTFSSEPGATGTTTINGTFRVQGVPAVVFPSIKNKPIADSANMDGAEALLSGSGQTGNSCAELLQQGHRRSGLYHLRLPGARSSFWQLLVHCDQEAAGGGWMVIQRRADFGEPRESFHRNWVEYRSGFGDPVREVWMGNVNLHLLTTTEDQVLRIELEDFDGEKRYAEYSTFRVASESDGFRLEVGGYSGDAGDALSDPWYGAHGSAFSTHDRDNDRSSLNCASMLKGGWWWKSCGRGLNGLYFDAQQPDSALARQGIVWFRWKGWDYTLKRATMMIRPKSFRPFNATSPSV